MNGHNRTRAGQHGRFVIAAPNEANLGAPWRFAMLCALCLGAVACAAEKNGQPAAVSDVEQADTSDADAAARGFALAKENCATCHAVEAGEIRSPNAAAPAFEELANRPEMTRMTLAALLQTPHRTMPNIVVEADEIDDLSAYLSALRRTY